MTVPPLALQASSDLEAGVRISKHAPPWTPSLVHSANGDNVCEQAGLHPGLSGG